jgi:hypothetical protein
MRAILSAAVVTVIGLLVACGGGDGNPDAQEIAGRVLQAIDQPGMVYHAVGDDGSEIWMDAANQRFRKKDAPSGGGLVSVGEGWIRVYYDPVANAVSTRDLTPKSSATPRIGNPAGSWLDALSALSYGNTLNFKVKSTADGVEVWVLEAATPIVDSQGNIAGTLAGRVEIAVETNLPHAFEGRTSFADGSTPTPDPRGNSPNRRIVYTTSEMIPLDSLPADFFSDEAVSSQVQTPEQNMQKFADAGLSALWLGVYYDGPGGILQLPRDTGVFVVGSQERAEIHYSLLIPVSATDAQENPDSVILRFARNPSAFKQPTIEQFAGELPEDVDSVDVRCQSALLYTSLLKVRDLPCDSDPCLEGDAALYRRVIFSVSDDTSVQIETAARAGLSGTDANGYNTRKGIIALAEALFPPEPLPSPTTAAAP